MRKIKVMSVFGTRPEAAKMLPLVKELSKEKNIISKVCVTAQHREMLDQVLDIFQVKPDYDLNIMKRKQSLTDITLHTVMGMDEILKKEKPDLLLVHGDTTTTFAASLAGYYNQVAIGHVEAGLRTYNKYEPFPEEANRKLTDALADLYFAPTAESKNNLLKENIADHQIFVTGNTVIDSFQTTLKKDYTFKENRINEISWNEKKVILLTAHRRENWGEGIANICEAVLKLNKLYDNLLFIYPVHKNPVVRETVFSKLKGYENILLIEPLDLQDMHNLMSKSYFILTDSGGIQEEAPALHKPVLVLRNVTERPEGLKEGTLKLVGTDQVSILEVSKNLLDNYDQYQKMANAKNPYGDGEASKRIVEAIKYYFQFCPDKPKDFS